MEKSHIPFTDDEMGLLWENLGSNYSLTLLSASVWKKACDFFKPIFWKVVEKIKKLLLGVM